MRLWTTKVTKMLLKINANQLRQAEIINMNRQTVDEKLWEISQLINPSTLQVKYDDLSNEYTELLKQYSKLYDEWSAISPDSAKQEAAYQPSSEYPEHIIDEENNHV